MRKNYANLEDIENDDLPNILTNFYTEVSKKKKGVNGDFEYKNTTLKCIRAAINRHFRETQSLDIIADHHFIAANEMFKGIQQKGKNEGRGEVESLPSIEEGDFQKLSNYFKEKMQGPPDPQTLQEINIFNIVYYMGQRGHENLRNMTKDTFKIDVDGDGKRYIYQVVKESDKNHKENDFSPNNAARIYEIEGTITFFLPI